MILTSYSRPTSREFSFHHVACRVNGIWYMVNCTLTWLSSSFSYTQSVFVLRHFGDNSCFRSCCTISLKSLKASISTPFPLEFEGIKKALPNSARWIGEYCVCKCYSILSLMMRRVERLYSLRSYFSPRQSQQLHGVLLSLYFFAQRWRAISNQWGLSIRLPSSSKIA